MRKDLEDSYKKMTAEPQPIIFSDIPKAKRTELIPDRDGPETGGGYGTGIFDAVDDGEFTLQAALRQNSNSILPPHHHRIQLQPSSPQGLSPPRRNLSLTKTQNTDQASPKPGQPAKKKPKSSKAPGPDDLFGMAMQDQRETRRKNVTKF